MPDLCSNSANANSAFPLAFDYFIAVWWMHLHLYLIFNTLCIYDMIEYSSVVFMFKVYNNQFPRHLLWFFDEILYDSHNHNTRKKVNNFKIKYSRTSQKASCISVICPKLWNNLHSDLQCSKSIYRFKTNYKIMLLQR